MWSREIIGSLVALRGSLDSPRVSFGLLLLNPPLVCPSPHHPHLSAAKGPTISSVFHHPLTGLQTCQELWLGQVVTSIEPSTITVLPRDDGVPYELSLPK